MSYEDLARFEIHRAAFAPHLRPAFVDMLRSDARLMAFAKQELARLDELGRMRAQAGVWGDHVSKIAFEMLGDAIRQAELPADHQATIKSETE